MQSTKPMIMDQHQSVFFHLPRELRDKVYHHYVWEEGGYIHDAASALLRPNDGGYVNISLQYTCKRVSKEMDGMALAANIVEFRTAFAPSRAVGQPSNASLFEQLLRYHRNRLRHMLEWAYTTVSVEVMLTLKSLYPNSLAVQKLMEVVQEEGNTVLQDGFLFTVWSLDYYNSGYILADLSKIMATQPDFYYLTSKEYDLELRRATASDDDDDSYGDDSNDGEAFSDDSGNMVSSLDSSTFIMPPSYSKDTQTKILQWRPRLWAIPNHAELEAISEFLPPWPTATANPVPDHEYVPNMYFSAAAVAIRFLEELAPKPREQLRKIVIQEDHPSVASSKTHAQGLISFCQANPKVRIERRVNVWPTEFVYRSNYFAHHTKVIVKMIATWINEVKILYQMGMPAGCFTLVLHGPSEEASQQLSDAITRAAIWLEGTVELARREQRQFHPFQGITEDFVDVIKEMLRGEIPARFDAEMDEVWDIEKILSEHVGDWPSKVSDVFRLQDFEEPEGGWHAAREAYKESEV